MDASSFDFVTGSFENKMSPNQSVLLLSLTVWIKPVRVSRQKKENETISDH